jgi:hypothetical protein
MLENFAVSRVASERGSKQLSCLERDGLERVLCCK